MAKIALVGASGFTGVELVKLLKKHPENSKLDLFSFSNAGLAIAKFSKELTKFNDTLKDFKKINYDNYDLVFFACPNGTAMKEYFKINKSKARLIDLAADFRLDNAKMWEYHYGIKHQTPEILSEIVYGLTEINRENIKNSKILANPGCYPTAAILALYPLLANKMLRSNHIIIDAKSGYSGAGREKIESGLYDKVKNNFIPYNFYKHRHHPEITQELNKLYGGDIDLTFSPHILPIYRGILETIYIELKKNLNLEEILNIYKEHYQNENFIKIKESGFSEIKNVEFTNNVQLSFHLGQNGKLTIISAIDNLLKGAAGQAIQNMNVMMGYKEDTALK